MKIENWRDCEEIPVIYGIKNIITNKWYIGSCVSMKDRIHRHWYYLTHNKHHSSKLQRSFNLYGISNFEVHILRYLKETELSIMFDIENTFINDFNSIKNGYNIIPASPVYSNWKLSQEAKDKVAKTHMKPVVCINRFTNNIYKIYKSITEAANDLKQQTTNISSVCKHKLRYLANYVFVYKEEYDNTKDYRVTENHSKGVPKSLSTREKMSLNSKSAKKVFKYDLNKNLICVYHSRSEAERREGFKKEFLRTRLNKPIGNYIFTYTEIKI